MCNWLETDSLLLTYKLCCFLTATIFCGGLRWGVCSKPRSSSFYFRVKKEKQLVHYWSRVFQKHQENVYLVQGLGGGVLSKSTRDNLGKQLVESGESDKW